jgi:phosphatidylinositol phospholipase C delta
MWDVSLQKLHGIRMQLMSEPGNLQLRQAVWEKQYWKGADMHKDQSLVYEELQKLCKRLHISTASGDLLRLFKEADTRNRGYLDFDDFRRLVKLLKARPDLDQLYKKLCTDHCKPFNFSVFEAFMRDSQKSTLTREELKAVFGKYADTKSHDASSSLSLDSAGTAQRGEPTTAEAADSLAVPVGAAEADQSSPAMTAEGFSAFLLSADNPAAMDQTRKVWHDMTRPLPEYYISSSHNTYLVGNQLVGVSTIEGYIRALLHSCRSVELDVYDGETEPVIYHGKTLTSKITLREVCAAIAKYAFVASPYPVIISAEVHCGLTQQDMIAKIMVEAFGDALVSAPIDDRPKIVALPSPEDLKGRILLKVKKHSKTRDFSFFEKGNP